MIKTDSKRQTLTYTDIKENKTYTFTWTHDFQGIHNFILTVVDNKTEKYLINASMPSMSSIIDLSEFLKAVIDDMKTI